jgi:3',5'-cyclic AMP phosphodiesterase CpdA
MRFAILGDLHFSDYPNPDWAVARDRLFTHFFEQVVALQPELVFAVGDTTNRGSLSEVTGLAAIAAASQVNLICVTGNHDCYSLSKSELAPFFLGGHKSMSAVDLYTYFDVGSTRFVLMDTARERDADNFGGFVAAKQLDWLTETIAEFNGCDRHSHLVVLGHHPLYGTTRRSTEAMLNIANSDATAQVFAQLTNKVGVYFCGHNHTHSIYRSNPDNWHHVQTANPLDCSSFRLVSIEDDRIDIETLDFDLGDELLQANFETARHHIPAGFTPQPFEQAYGEMGDRHLSIRYSSQLQRKGQTEHSCH